ncbi:MAG: hypothetical protein P8J49_04020 [SAR324 cluster bacterium]|nr:hypothetical protein [SAR324 cluster bacterium]
MKQLSKMMLAAVASVALATSAYAWDFSASGSSSAQFNSTSTTVQTGATAVPSGGVGSEQSSLKLASSHTDGSKTLALSYTIDWDGNLDETITLTGTSTVGAWTASGDVSYNRDDGTGCSQGDNTTVAVAKCAQGGGQTGEDTGTVTLTNGTMTIKLGDAAHIANQNVSSGGAAAGQVSMVGDDDDIGIGAFVDGFNGVSLAYKISDTMSVTGAYEKHGAANDMMGTVDFLDGETAASHGTTGMGLSFSGTFGPATVGVSQMSSSTADVTGDAALGKKSTKASTMGLGVKIDLGDIDPFISYGSVTATSDENLADIAVSGSEIGLTYALRSDSVVLLISNVEERYSKDDKPLARSGMELGYNTTVGPASLKIGYGSQSSADADKPTGQASSWRNDGYAMTDIEIALGYSF